MTDQRPDPPRFGNAVRRTESAIARIKEKDPAFRAITRVDQNGAFAAAAKSDKRIADGLPPRPLEGALLGIKDNLAVNGLPWTGGLAGWRNRIAEGDSHVVACLRQAGAIPLAMTNMHEGALGATTDNPHFGRTENPHKAGYTPGGSSGGSGAALAAGLVDIALGTDTMGSVRIPAGYCGVFGLKPTAGLVSRSGLVFLAPSLDTIGPMARNLNDITVMINVMAGPDPTDTESAAPPPGWGQFVKDEDAARTLRIGVPTQIDDVGCDPEVLDALHKVRKTLEASGCIVEHVDIAAWEPGRARRGGLLLSEAEGAFELSELLDGDDPGAMSDDLRAMLMYGRGLTSTRLVHALARIRQANAALNQAFQELDLVMMPTAPQNAFPHEVEIPSNQADFCCVANFSGRPSLAIPIWKTGAALPSSVQFLGRPFGEMDLIRVGRIAARNG